MTVKNELRSVDVFKDEYMGPTGAQRIPVLSSFEDEYLTFTQAAERFPAFTEGGLRWHRFNNTGGFNQCVRQIGRKCVISLRDFHIWMGQQTRC
jgi:hypothetical protein